MCRVLYAMHAPDTRHAGHAPTGSRYTNNGRGEPSAVDTVAASCTDCSVCNLWHQRTAEQRAWTAAHGTEHGTERKWHQLTPSSPASVMSTLSPPSSAAYKRSQQSVQPSHTQNATRETTALLPHRRTRTTLNRRFVFVHCLHLAKQKIPRNHCNGVLRRVKYCSHQLRAHACAAGRWQAAVVLHCGLLSTHGDVQ